MTLACTIAAAVIVILGLFAVIIDRPTERDEAREQVRRLESECNEHAAVSADLARRLAEAESTTVRVPLLRVVPPSDEVTAAEWPAIMRAVEGEIGGAS